MYKQHIHSIICCSLFSILLLSNRAAAQPKLEAINAVYITKALYNDSFTSDANNRNIFLKYLGYYLKGRSINELDRYPYLGRLYTSYNFTLPKDSLFAMIDSEKLYRQADRKYTSLKDVRDDIVAQKDSISNNDWRLRTAELRLRTLRVPPDAEDSTRLALRQSLLTDSLDRLTHQGDTLGAAQAASYRNMISAIDSFNLLGTRDTMLRGGLSKLFDTLRLRLVELSSGGRVKDLREILVDRCTEACRSMVSTVQYNFGDRLIPSGNEYTFMNESNNIQASQSGSGFSMPGQSEMIDAMAIFLANRVEQESVLWFFDELKKKAKLIEELNIVFPACMALLKNNEEYDMPKIGKAWRYAIAQDFSVMPQHFFQIPFIDSLPKNKIAINVLRQYVGYGGEIASLMQKRYSIDETINNLYLNLKGRLSDKYVTPDHFITLLYAVKQEIFLVSKGNKYLLNPSTLVDMPDDMFMTMLSLVDLKYDKVFSKILLRKNDDFDFRPDEILKVKNVLARMLQEMQQVDNVTRRAKSRDNDKDNIDFSTLSYTTWQFTSDLIKVFDDLLTATTNSKAIFADQAYNLQTDLETLRGVLDVYAHIDKKDYYGAVREMFNLAYALTKRYPRGADPREFQALQKDIALYRSCPVDTGYRARKIMLNEIRKQLLVTEKLGFENLEASPEIRAPYPLIAINKTTASLRGPLDSAGINEIKRELNFDKTRYFVLRIASFLNDISGATNSKDLSKVISAYALPATSYKRKTSTWNSLFLNAFVGPYLGYETLPLGRSSSANLTYKSGYVYGLTAPIGIAFSKTFSRFGSTPTPDDVDCKFISKGKHAGKFRNMSKSTFTVFVSLLDIGAVVSYRLSNSDSTLPQSFKWEQFVSPGLHLQYSIHGTPLVFSMGGVYAPQIRKIGDGNRQYNAIRAYAGVLFDIPIMAIHSKEKYKGIHYQPAE
ncbi:MAG: hypothetical protein JSS82_10430 [Bacteroidetes bacterium]|nr:hypothetical protein [Bacteroidota bacterium]